MKYVIKRISSTSTTRSIEKTVRMLEECYTSVDGVIEPKTISLIGKAGAGKTHVLAEFCIRHPAIRTPHGLIAPILRVNAPFRPTPRSLADRLLQELEPSAFSRRSTESAITAQLCSLIWRARPKIVVIDDLHHFMSQKLAASETALRTG